MADINKHKGTAQLTVDGKTFDMPILGGTIGPDVIDIRALYKETGMFTYDPGFTSTASCESQIFLPATGAMPVPIFRMMETDPPGYENDTNQSRILAFLSAPTSAVSPSRKQPSNLG